MELRQLRAFSTIAQVKSFTLAGEILGYAQSSITSQIKSLEEELGTKLFERLGRQVILTKDGSAFLNYAKQILQLSEEATTLFQPPHQPYGTLCIGAGETLTLTKLAPLLQEYRNRYPSVDLTLRTGSSGDFHSWLKNNRIDIAFAIGPIIDIPELITTPLGSETTVAVVSADHVLAKTASLSLQNLGQTPLVLPERGCQYRSLLEQMLQDANLQPPSIFESSSFAVMKQFVASGFGLAILPYFAVEQELKSGQLISIPWAGPSFPMFLQVWRHRKKWLSAPLTAFLALLEETSEVNPNT